MVMKLDWVNEQHAAARRRAVLVVIGCVETATWLTDALPLLAADHRIATFFTVAPVGNDDATDEYLRARGLPVLPWRHATGSAFDLVLTHESELTAARKSFPDTVPVASDVSYERLLASIPFRAGYRRVFGLAREQKLVLVSWAERGESTVEYWFGLLGRLTRALPPERYRVAAVVPASLWGVCGGWQVRTWLADHLRAGLLVLQPETDWRAALVAANLVVGDLGPATRYGAALGLPVMVAASEVSPLSGGAAGLLRRHAPRLRCDQPLLDQVVAARQADRAWQDGVAARIAAGTGHAGDAGRAGGTGYAGDLLRRSLYGRLGLTEPVRPVSCAPMPSPHFVHDEMTW